MITAVASALPEDSRPIDALEERTTTSRRPQSEPAAMPSDKLSELVSLEGEEAMGRFAHNIDMLASSGVVLSCPSTTGAELSQLREALRQALHADRLDHGLINALLRGTVEAIEVGEASLLTIRFEGALAGSSAVQVHLDHAALCVGIDEAGKSPDPKGYEDIASDCAERIWKLAAPLLSTRGIPEEGARDLLMRALTAMKARTHWDRRAPKGVANAEVRSFMRRFVRSGAWDALIGTTGASDILSFADGRRIDALRSRSNSGVTEAELAAIDRDALRAVREASSGRLQDVCVAVEMRLDGHSTAEILERTGVTRANVYANVRKVARHGPARLARRKKRYYELDAALIGKMAEAVRQGLDRDHERRALGVSDLLALVRDDGAEFLNLKAFRAALRRQDLSLTKFRAQALSVLAESGR